MVMGMVPRLDGMACWRCFAGQRDGCSLRVRARLSCSRLLAAAASSFRDDTLRVTCVVCE
eukprot:3088454-Rhodomonas_salina.2